MKNITKIILILVVFLFPYNIFAVNTHTPDLEDTTENSYLHTTANGVNIPGGNTDRSFEAWVKLESGGVLRSVIGYGTLANQQKWQA